MRYVIIAAAALTTSVSAHGMIRSIEGANNVSMPGLSVADGTPRDCSSNGCGSQADTSIIRDSEMGNDGTALGRTEGNGPVKAADMISNFMGTGQAPSNNGAQDSTGTEDDLSRLEALESRRAEHKRQISNLFGGLFGGGNNNDNNDDNDDSDTSGGNGGGSGLGGLFGGFGGGGGGNSGLGGLFGGGGGSGGQKNEFAQETLVADTAGQGAQSGLPTCSDDGEISMVFRQINQDGAGPMEAAVDGTSGGSDPDAFQDAEITQDVPGLGIQGLSLATTTEFPMKVKMPDGMTCDASVGGADNVCIVRVRNGAAAGPFGGSGAFTMTTAARRRAVAYRLKKRMEINREV